MLKLASSVPSQRRFDIKILRRIRRQKDERAPKKYDQQTLSKESEDLAHACDSPPRLREIPRILFERCHNVPARVEALCIL